MTSDAHRILALQALRAFAYGLGSVLIGVTLARRGLSGFEVGLVLAALLAGVALTSVAIARTADRVGRRRWYAALFLLMGLAGIAFALTDEIWLLVLAALSGTVSTEVVESGPFTSLEQAMLPSAVGVGGDPTRLFGTYNTVATLAGSAGALAAALVPALGVEPQRLLLVYAAVGVVGAVDRSWAVRRPRGGPAVGRGAARTLARHRPEAVRAVRSRLVRRRLRHAGLHRLLVHDDLRDVARGARRRLLRPRPLQSISFQVATRLAARFGLLNTMVFTHLPSNVLLAAIPFAPTEAAAFALLLARALLSQMDVPTRQAYVVGVVDSEERAAAAAYTNTARYVTRPLGPLVAAPIMQLSLCAPFVVAGVLKSVYDLTLYRAFRRRPPSWTTD